VVTKWPASSEAVWAQRGAVISNIALNKTEAAQVAVDKLLSDYFENANIAEAVFNVADTYYWFKHYEKANELYQYVLDTWPAAEHAMWAQMGLAISNIADGNDPAAEAATKNLITNFAGNERLPEALFYIAGRYGWDRKYDQAKSIYQQIIQNWPDNSFAGNAEFELARTNIFSLIDFHDEPNALVAIDKFISDFNDRPDLPAVLYEFAARYNQLKEYKPSNFTEAVYQRAINQFLKAPQARSAQLNILRMNILSFINSGDDPNAMTTLDTLIADFNNYPDLTWTVFPIIEQIAEQYYGKARLQESKGHHERAKLYYRKFIDVWEKIITQLSPSAAYTPQAYYCSAGCYNYNLGEYEKAIEYYQKLLDNWHDFDYRRVSYAWFGIACCYEQLEKSGRISTAEAAVQICQACDELLTNYPDTNPLMIQTARKLLKRYEVSKQ